MTFQLQFFGEESDERPWRSLEGFRYQPGFIDPRDEGLLIERLRDLPFREFDFHGFTGKRRVVSFGWRYDYSGGQLQEADEVPDFLLPLRARAASFAEVEAEDLQQALVTEYRPGSGIGWHRDKAVFGQVVGVSLLASCVLRFRRKTSGELSRDRGPRDAGARSGSAHSKQPKVKQRWERVNVAVEPRSAYLLSGSSRSEWEHSILRVDELRYAVTFRNVRKR